MLFRSGEAGQEEQQPGKQPGRAGRCATSRLREAAARSRHPLLRTRPGPASTGEKRFQEATPPAHDRTSLRTPRPGRVVAGKRPPVVPRAARLLTEKRRGQPRTVNGGLEPSRAAAGRHGLPRAVLGCCGPSCVAAGRHGYARRGTRGRGRQCHHRRDSTTERPAPDRHKQSRLAPGAHRATVPGYPPAPGSDTLHA